MSLLLLLLSAGILLLQFLLKAGSCCWRPCPAAAAFGQDLAAAAVKARTC